jgi:hypothetical protein
MTILKNISNIYAALGIITIWTGFVVFIYGMTHATLDGAPLGYPTIYNKVNLFVILLPISAFSFYFVVVRRSDFLLNLFLFVALLWLIAATLGLIDGGYQFTYWHHGDLLCTNGCNSIIILSWLAIPAGIVAFRAPSIVENDGIVGAATLYLLIIFIMLLVPSSFVLTLAF